MPSKSSRRARLCLERLGERCLLSYGLSPNLRVSHGDPYKFLNGDDPQHQIGTLYGSTALETWLAVDPTNTDHMVGIWQEDRWSTAGCRGLVAGVSFDGGQTWQDISIPGLSQVTGGATPRTSDPWVAFAANGDLFAASLTVGNGGSPGNAQVSKSTDGGLTWVPPVLIPNSNGADKESITCDPSDPNLAYVVYTGAYSRTTDGGQTWAPARSLGTGSGSQIVVLPDGTLLDSDGGEAFRSTDHGQTWGQAIGYFLNEDPRFVIDPNTHQQLRAGLGLGDISVDPNSGAVYVVIEDAGLGPQRQYDAIAFTESLDGGLHWTTPVKINQTPTDIPVLDQQAFIPTVQLAGDGTVGVTYYDFRYNTGGPTLPTDYWFIPGTPDGSGGITWGPEIRLTNKSFDYEQAPFSVYGKMIGDYQGHATVGNDFLEMFGHPHGRNQDGIFFRRIYNLGPDTAGNSGTQSVATALGAPAGASTAVVVTPASLAAQPAAVDMSALPVVFVKNADPGASGFVPANEGSPDATISDAVFGGDNWNLA
jgi:hypothetical protein